MASARLATAPSRRVTLASMTAIAALAAALVSVAGVVIAPPAAAEPAATVPVGVPPQRPAGVAAATSAPADQPMRLHVALRPRDPDALSAFVTAVSTPGSAGYRDYLPAGAFGSRFGATDAAIASVTAALRGRGLTVGAASPNRLSIPVSGTVAQVSNAFQTAFTQYQLRSGEKGLVNTTAPRLPAAVAAYVQGVVGLNQLTHAISSQPADARPAKAVMPPFAPAATSAPPPGDGPATACAVATATATANSAYTSVDLARHYGIDSVYPTTTGKGATVAVFELEPFDPTDIAAFQACYGTHTTVSSVKVGGGAGSGAGSGEAALDIEQVIGLAPSANVVVYEAPNDGANVYNEFQQIANDDTAQVVSDSWGLCEAESGVPELAELERPLLQQMAAQGQTVLAATGDSGSEGCYSAPTSTDTSLSVWEPASQPEVTAVGGTTVATLTGPDTAWHDKYGASGGGLSTLWTMPSYQHALATIAESAGAGCSAPTGQLCRETPDVSASADVAHGSLAYYSGAWHVIGGTSAATPLWASIIALADASCAAGPVGFMNPALYQLAAPTSTAIADVTTGPDNDFTASHPGQYATKRGYDLVTGLGTPVAAQVITQLCPAAGTPGSGTMTVSPATAAVSSVVTLTFTYTPAAGSGMVDGELDLTVPGTWTLPSTDPSAPGYTTASAGMLSIIGTTITVTGITVPAGKNVTITYGDTSGGGGGVRTPLTPQATVFSARSRSQQSGATAPLAISPAIRILSGNGSSGQATLTREAGVDRVGTAIAASHAGFPTAGSAGAVVLARDDTFPDALAGVPLAAAKRGPLLLTSQTALLASVATEIQRVLPLGSTVYVLGGSAALAPNIDGQIQSLGYVPVRLEGVSRFDTAVRIADELGQPTTVFEADGLNFPDALSAGPAAVITHGAVLLTNGNSPAPATTAYLAQHPQALRYAIGGPAATADPTAQRFAGTDRYATSVLVAQSFFIQPSTIGIASGVTFADALSGGPVTALAGGPLVLAPASGALPSTTQGYLSSVASSVLTGWLFGGTAALSTQVADEVAQSLVLVPPAS